MSPSKDSSGVTVPLIAGSFALAGALIGVLGVRSTSKAQLEGIKAEVKAALKKLQLEREYGLLDHRRERHESTILELQDALAKFAGALQEVAMKRLHDFEARKEWRIDSGSDLSLKAQSAYLTAHKLAQRLPRTGSDDSEAWESVDVVLDELHAAIRDSSNRREQNAALFQFENGVIVAQDQLGKWLDRLDQDMLAQLTPVEEQKRPLA